MLLSPGASTEGLFAVFSPAGEALALATAGDGRVRTFDSGTGRLRANAGGPSTSGKAAGSQLAERVTCVAWVPARKEKGKKKQQQGQAAAGSSLIVVGTAAGDVKAFDTQLGDLKWRCSSCLEGGVTSIAYSPVQGGVVYAAGSSKQICAIDPATGELRERFEASKHPITSVAVSPDGRHIFGGGSSLALWDATSHERLAKYSGHPTPVRTVAFAPSGLHAASASPGERHVALWSTSDAASASAPAAKRAKKMHVAVGQLSMEDPAVALASCPAHPLDESSTAFCLGAVSEAGEAYVWLCSPQPQGSAEGEGVKAQLLARVRVGEAPVKGAVAGHSEAILAVKLHAGTKGPSLLVARGSSVKPAFEQVAVSAAVSEPALVCLKPSDSGLLLDSNVASGKQQAGQQQQAAGAKEGKEAKQKLQHTRTDVTVLGPENAGQPVLLQAQAAAAAGRKRPAVEGAEDGQGAAQQEEGEEVADEEALLGDERPLGERVSALEAAAGGAARAAAGAEDADASAAQPTGSNKADSLAVLLTQALRANDRSLLERCLATSNTRVIVNTVRRIVPMDAALFLRAAVDRLLSRPARALQLAPWIKALLHHHTGYLMSAPGAQAPLTALYQAIDGRLAMQQQLLKVYGRLGLVMAHSRSGKEAAEGEDGAAGAVSGRPEPEVVYEDASDEEEPDAEDPFAALDDESDEGDDSDNDDLGSDDDLMGMGGDDDEFDDDDDM